MAVAVTYASTLTVVETVADTYVASGDNTLTYNGMNSSGTYNSGTATPVTKHASFQQALTTGAATIDLRALTGPNGATVDGNGLKVQFVKFRNKSTNANSMTLTFGASNPYDLFGSTFVLTLAPGQEFLAFLKEGAPDIDATNKTIDVSGTGSQILECEIVMG